MSELVGPPVPAARCYRVKLVPPNIPEPVEQFVRKHIHSVLQLEILLWLRERGQDASIEEVAAELRVTEQSSAIRLEDLALRGLLANGSDARRYRYAPRTPDLSAAVDALAECYSRARHSVIERIFSEPGDSARSLAEAFRIKKKRGD